MQITSGCKRIVFAMASGATLVACLATVVSAEVPDTNSYWKNLSAAEKVAKRYLDGVMQSCRGRSGADAEAALKEWNAAVQPTKYPDSEFNPCSGTGTLVVGNTSIVAFNGRAIKLSEGGSLQTEWDLRAHTVRLWFGGDHISIAIAPISVSIQRASLGFFNARGQSGFSETSISESLIISGLEAFWRSAHDRYPNHSMYDVALQVITGKDEGQEMLLDFIRCGKSLCE